MMEDWLTFGDAVILLQGLCLRSAALVVVFVVLKIELILAKCSNTELYLQSKVSHSGNLGYLLDYIHFMTHPVRSFYPSCSLQSHLHSAD
jgi:hypothetical protein